MRLEFDDADSLAIDKDKILSGDEVKLHHLHKVLEGKKPMLRVNVGRFRNSWKGRQSASRIILKSRWNLCLQCYIVPW
jgi:hypothetical protein